MRRLALVLLLAGCVNSSELAESDRVPGPHPVWSREPEVGGTTRSRHLPRNIDPEVLEALLPEGSWDLELSDGGAAIHASSALLDRIDRLSAAVERAREPYVFTVAAYEVPFRVANSLGPIQKAAGAGTRNAFLMVPLRAGAVEKLLARHGPLVGSTFAWSGTKALAGQWATVGLTSSTARIGGIAWTSSARLSFDVQKETIGVRGRIAAIPPTEEGTTLVTFRVHERLPVADETLECSAFSGFTRVPVNVPAVIERHAEDTVALGPGEELGLVGLGSRPGWFELIVIGASPAR